MYAIHAHTFGRRIIGTAGTLTPSQPSNAMHIWSRALFAGVLACDTCALYVCTCMFVYFHSYGSARNTAKHSYGSIPVVAMRNSIIKSLSAEDNCRNFPSLHRIYRCVCVCRCYAIPHIVLLTSWVSSCVQYCSII